MVRLLAKTPNEGSMLQGVDLTLEIPNHITSSGTNVETLFNGSIRKTLSDWVVDILQANGGHLRLKKLRKQSKAGSNKQQQWTSVVQNVISKSAVQDPLLCQVMQELQSSENLPRKKQKFLNFMKSKYRRLRPDQVEQIWEILDSQLYSLYKASVSTSCCRISSQEFEQQLLDAISSRKTISYSEADGMVRLLAKTPNEGSMLQGVDLTLEIPNHITSSGTNVETLFNGSIRKTLSDWVVDILQANGGHLRLKKLRKQFNGVGGGGAGGLLDRLPPANDRRGA
ncbi:hypothetical protein T265_15553, partial [Opisthorchis viverrini]